MIKVQRVSGAQGDGPQRIIHLNTLVGSENPAAGRLSIHCAPGSKQGVERCDGCIRMDSKGHANPFRSATGVHARGPIWSHRQTIVLISPVVDVIGKEV